MSNIIQRISSVPTEADFTQEQLDLIKATVAKGATNEELRLFLYRCKNMGLDPLKPGMVHFVKYGNSPGTMIVGIEGFRSKAKHTGKLAGIQRGIIRDEKGKCVGGWCEVKHADWEKPAREEVSLAEYNTGKSQWAKMPETMIKKVAEAAALRMVFPDEVGGLYVAEEMNQAQSDPRAKEIEARIALEPEVEVEQIPEAPPSVGDYVIKIGKMKGKKLKTLTDDKLFNMLDWYEQETLKPDFTPHKDLVEYIEKIREYLSEGEAVE